MMYSLAQPSHRVFPPKTCYGQSVYGVRIVAARTSEVSTSLRIHLQGEIQYVAIVLELLDFCLPCLVGAHASKRPSRRPFITSRLLHLSHSTIMLHSFDVVCPLLL